MTLLLRLATLLLAGALLAGCEPARDAYALTSTGTIVRFKTDKADNIDKELTPSGLNSGEVVLQIDFRPKDKQLYALTSGNRIATINTSSGAATYVGSTAFTTAVLNLPVMDINPVGDYARVIDYQSTGNSTFNGRVSLVDGTLIQTDGDGTLSFKTGDAHEGEQPQLVAIAHSNAKSDATTTTLYGLELNSQSLVSITTGGVLTTVGQTSRGFTINSGFDIVPSNDLPYVIVNSVGNSAKFYGLNLSSALIDNGKTLGGNRTIRSLAVVLKPPKRSGFQ